MITEKTIKDAMAQEHIADAKENLENWLSYLPTDAKNLVETLRRAHSAACEVDGVTAILLAQHLKTAEDLAWQLSLLECVRRK